MVGWRTIAARTLATLAALAAAALVALTPAAYANPLSVADREFVDQAVADIMEQGRIPGATMMIRGPNGNYVRTYGLGDVEANTPIRRADHVRIASITKTFVATAILRRIDRGRLRLSDTIDRWVKGVPNGDRITIRQLLAMRSGVYNFSADPSFSQAFDANPTMTFKPRGAIRIIKRHAPDFEPGADFEYSDSNYTLLGIVLQKLAGRSVESVIKRAILKRLELRETSFPTTPNLRTPFSHGYYAGNDGTEPIMDYTAVNPAVPWTAGGMVSTIDDLRRWGKALATGTLISKRLQRKRLKFGTAPNPGGPPAGYGLGILRFGDWIGHDGAIFGFSTVTMYLPSNGAQIVAVANLSTNATTPTFDMFRSIAKRLYPSSLD